MVSKSCVASLVSAPVTAVPLLCVGKNADKIFLYYWAIDIEREIELHLFTMSQTGVHLPTAWMCALDGGHILSYAIIGHKLILMSHLNI
jgi:hypothetical protein